MKNILLPCVLIATIIATPGSSQSVDEFTQEEIMSIRTRVYTEYYERSCKE